MEPVTLSGWYENEDGTVSYYAWDAGQLHTVATVADWAAVSVHEREECEAFDIAFG